MRHGSLKVVTVVMVKGRSGFGLLFARIHLRPSRHRCQRNKQRAFC